MSKVKVIKDNDGVAVVEGTPAASLIKDSEKLFNAPIPERKAGEKLVFRDISAIQRDADLKKAMDDAEKIKQSEKQAAKIDPNAINIRQPTPKDLEQMNNPPGVEPVPVLETLSEGSKFAEPAMESSVKEKTPQEAEPKRQEAVNRTREYKRQRFIERSAGEQAATQGSFITTLQT
tara:strand:+ start:106 stop:633 length:528 start_codon:yes stop_codon:yes gene_type:complete